MDKSQNVFGDVTLLITHYNRSSSLERLLKTFRDLDVSFNEIVVSDDASQAIHLDYLKRLSVEYRFKLITAAVNGGLGNNLNKGQLGVSSPYTLYIQEDFIPLEDFIIPFKDAMEIIRSEAEIDIIRFYAYYAYPYLEPYKKGFSKVIYKPWFMNPSKIYNYTDHPHLRRSTFFDKFGTYTEAIKSDKTEYEMCVSFIQNKGRALFFDNYKSLFLQENSAEEPSTVTRSNWRASENPIVSSIRYLYRLVKYNYDIHIDKKFVK